MENNRLSKFGVILALTFGVASPILGPMKQRISHLIFANSKLGLSFHWLSAPGPKSLATRLKSDGFMRKNNKSNTIQGLCVTNAKYVFEEEPKVKWPFFGIYVSRNQSHITHEATVVHECNHVATSLYSWCKSHKKLPDNCSKHEFIAYMAGYWYSIYRIWEELGFPDEPPIKPFRRVMHLMDELFSAKMWKYLNKPF